MMDKQQLNRRAAGCTSPPGPKILQFGGGNFLRAFLNWMIDLMNERVDFQGSALVVKPTAEGTYSALERQEGLFHVCLRGTEESDTIDRCRLIQSVHSYVHPYRNFDGFLRTAEMPELRLVVSNTTEAGIRYRPEDRFDDQPAASFPGKLCQWLFHRYRHFEGGAEGSCMILPCELVEQNGQKLREIVERYATQWELEEEFPGWLRRHVSFYDTLVDRIVPGFPSEAAATFRERLGYADELLTVAEPYHLWAIEGDEKIKQWFPAKAAGLNVQIVDDLGPFRTLKVRLLNGAHTAMVPVGLLAGLTSVREVIEDPVTGAFIKDLLFEELIPSLDHSPSEAFDYARTVLDRFRNPFIRHRLEDISLNSTAKFVSRLQPSLEQYFIKKETLPSRLVVSMAALITFYKGGVAPLRDEPAAVDHFKKAWQQPTLAETSRHALAYWTFAPALQAMLEKEVTVYLQHLQKYSLRKVLTRLGRTTI